MFLKGDLLIRLEPLIDELPVIGGIAPQLVQSESNNTSLQGVWVIYYGVLSCTMSGWAKTIGQSRLPAFSTSRSQNFTTLDWQRAGATVQHLSIKQTRLMNQRTWHLIVDDTVSHQTFLKLLRNTVSQLSPWLVEQRCEGSIVKCNLFQWPTEQGSWSLQRAVAGVDSNILRQLLQSAVAKAMVLPHAPLCCTCCIKMRKCMCRPMNSTFKQSLLPLVLIFTHTWNYFPQRSSISQSTHNSKEHPRVVGCKMQQMDFSLPWRHRRCPSLSLPNANP